MRRTGPSPTVRADILDRDGSCCLCGAPADEIQHRRARGMGGTRRADTNSPANLVALCRPCHWHVESAPEWAAEMGYRVSQQSVPAFVPLFWHGVRVLLDDAGNVRDVA